MSNYFFVGTYETTKKKYGIQDDFVELLRQFIVFVSEERFTNIQKIWGL